MVKKMIKGKQDKFKKIIIENLEKFPIVQIACEKSNISRSTYYRRIEEDSNFLRNTELAIQNGKCLVNDVAETNIISKMKDGDLKATMFWLNNNHQGYSNKIIQQNNYLLQNNSKTPKIIENILNKFKKGK